MDPNPLGVGKIRGDQPVAKMATLFLTLRGFAKVAPQARDRKNTFQSSLIDAWTTVAIFPSKLFVVCFLLFIKCLEKPFCFNYAWYCLAEQQMSPARFVFGEIRPHLYSNNQCDFTCILA